MSTLRQSLVILLGVLTFVAFGFQLWFVPTFIWGEPQDLMTAGYAIVFFSQFVLLLGGTVGDNLFRWLTREVEALSSTVPDNQSDHGSSTRFVFLGVTAKRVGMSADTQSMNIRQGAVADSESRQQPCARFIAAGRPLPYDPSKHDE